MYTTGLSVLVILEAFLPAIAIGVWLYFTDRVEREPIGLLVVIFALSMIFTIPCAMGEQLLTTLFFPHEGMSSVLALFVYYIFVVGLLEEASKGLAALIPAWRSKHFNHSYDAIVYCVISALGFAGFENISYIMAYGHGVVWGRALFSVPFHACCGLIMGLFIAHAKACQLKGNKAGKWRYLLLGWIVPALVHGIYDAGATLQESGMLSFSTFAAVFVCVVVLLLWRRHGAASVDALMEGAVETMPVREGASGAEPQSKDAPIIEMLNFDGDWICPICGFPNDGSNAFCPRCGCKK
ncbi:MAG: PrsW family intramembrane metalloprotease [bacterium]|nr:PrsW family intramembrane metalloprotease [bacterium]